MSETIVREFTASRPHQKIKAFEVDEGDMLAAAYSPETPYLATLGVYTCKAIAVHSREARRGLLAHLASTDHIEISLGHIVEAYDDDLEAADVSVLQAGASSEERPSRIPSIGAIADYFVSLNVRSVSLDTGQNVAYTPLRGMTLHLFTGVVTDFQYEDPHTFRRYLNLPERIRVE